MAKKNLSESEKINICLDFLFYLIHRDKNFKKIFNKAVSKFGLDDDVVLSLVESTADDISEKMMNEIDSFSEPFIREYLSIKNSQNCSQDMNKQLI